MTSPWPKKGDRLGVFVEFTLGGSVPGFEPIAGLFKDPDGGQWVYWLDDDLKVVSAFGRIRVIEELGDTFRVLPEEEIDVARVKLRLHRANGGR